MHCSLKEKLSHLAKHFLWGGMVGGSLKSLMSLGDQEENVSGKENSPPMTL